MKKVTTIILGLAVLLTVACEKDKEPTPDAQPVTNTPAAPKCQLTEWQIYEYPFVFSYSYQYNAQGKLTTKNILRSGAPYGNIDFEYNPGGQVSKMSWYYNNKLWEYYTYTYNAAGKLEKQYNFVKQTTSGPVLDSWYVFDYDAGNKLIRQSVLSPGGSAVATQYWDITYPAANKAISKLVEVHATGPQVSRTDEYTFDNQPHAQRFGEVPTLTDMLSEHNLDQWSSTYFNGSTNVVNTWDYIYRYNADGFPTAKRTAYNGSTVLSDSMVYNCH